MVKIWGRANHALYQFTYWLFSKRIFKALRSAFSLMFPFVFLGATVAFIATAIFGNNGFFKQIFVLNNWFPFFQEIQAFMRMLNQVTNGLTALIGAFAAAHAMAKTYGFDGWPAGITSSLSWLMLSVIRPNPNAVGNSQIIFSPNTINVHGLFFALLTGLLIGWVFSEMRRHHMSKRKQKLLYNNRTQGLVNLLPTVLILTIAGITGWLLATFLPQGIGSAFTNLVNSGVSHINHSILRILIGVFTNSLLWSIGIPGPLTLDTTNLTGSETLSNLTYALEHHTAWGVPNAINVHSIYDSYAAIGGTGMTLGLILAILIYSHQTATRRIASLSIMPGIVNINDPLLVGIPIILNPIMMIPFILSPLAASAVAYAFTKLQLMPPAVYPVPTTTPGFLMGFLGTSGNSMALFVGILNLILATLIYLPFVRLADRVETALERDETNA